MLTLLYLSTGAAILCVAVLVILKYISISKIRIDNRDQKKKLCMSTVEVLALLRNLKPFPVSIHKGWKLHSFQNSCRVWTQEVSVNSSDTDLHMFATFSKVKVPPQVVIQILKDVTKISSWKPGCLATSITFNAGLDTGSTVTGLMGNTPVQHDIVIEETSPTEIKGIQQMILAALGQNITPQSVTKEYKRYWHREDNGVCWHLQMCERQQQWLYFLAQPVEDVDRSLLTVLSNQDADSPQTSATYLSEVMGSFIEYIQYRKLPTTPLLDIKVPTGKYGRLTKSNSSSDEAFRASGAGNKMFLRFRSLVEKPSFGADKFHSFRRQLVRSASILRHQSTPVSDCGAFDFNLAPKQLKTCSLDRKDMPSLSSISQGSVEDLEKKDVSAEVSEQSSSADNETVDNNNQVKPVDEESAKTSSEISNVAKNLPNHTSALEKDIDKTLDEDVNDQEKYDQINEEIISSSGSKVDIKHIVMANQSAAELLAVALQASNIDLSKSIEEQVVNSGGWMFCGLENDVVVLQKISVKENVKSYLGKGVIQATPKTVWNAIRNPRTRFTYDDSLKKVDVLETVSDTIKIVYYYHEMLQLFKTESFDMILSQNERSDRGDKYVLALQSVEKPEVAVPEGTLRVKVLPSGWILEPLMKDRRVFTMVTYIMQIDFGDVRRGMDKSPYEELISKQPLCIAFLRQYLRGIYMKN